MLTSLALRYLAVSSTLVVLVTSSSVPDPTKPLPSDDTHIASCLPVNSGGIEALYPEEQHLSPSTVTDTLTCASLLAPKMQRKIPNVPRQAILFEVLENDLVLPYPNPDDLPTVIISQDMTKFVIRSNLTGTQLFDIDPDNTLEGTEKGHPIGSSAIAVSNNGKFTVRVAERRVDETVGTQVVGVRTELYTNLHANEDVRIQGTFHQDNVAMEASFSPDSAWALLRSPSNALHLWKAVEKPSEEQPGQNIEISREAKAAAIGDGIFAYVEGLFLYVRRLDTNRTTLLETPLKNFGHIHKMAICGDRIGMIQGNQFSSYNLDNTMHSKDYFIDVRGAEVISFAFHDTHIAVIGAPKSRLYVYDLNKPSKEKRTKKELANIVLNKYYQYASVKDFDNDSFEALEYKFASAQLYFRRHRIQLEQVGKENGTAMTSMLPQVIWSLIGLYMQKPRVLHQLSGELPDQSEAPAPAKPRHEMNKLIARSLKTTPQVLAVDNHIAYFTCCRRFGPMNVTPHLLSFDSRTKISRDIVAIPDGVTVSNIHPSPDGNRFVLFANEGAVYLTSAKKDSFHKITTFKHDSTTRVYLHPFQPLIFIYHDDTLYLIDDISKPPKKVELFCRGTQTLKIQHFATEFAHFSSTREVVVKKKYLHRFTYMNVLPDI